MDPDVATKPSSTTGTLTTCTMVIYTIHTTAMLMNIPSPSPTSIQTHAHRHINAAVTTPTTCMAPGVGTKPFPTAITRTTWSTGIYTIHMATIVMITVLWSWWPLEIAEQKIDPVLNRIHEDASQSRGSLGARAPKRLSHF